VKNTVNIEDSTPDDVLGIRDVQKITWLDTYPNSDLGVTEKDVESYFDIDQAEEKRTLENLKKAYSDPNQHRWIAKNGKKIVGFCAAFKGESAHRIAAIYILPLFQGEGLGKKLMKRALLWLGNKKDIYVNLASYNTKALKFYERFGFAKTGKNAVSTVTLPSGKILPEVEMVKNN
jgi:diamine N-acetyltransferase